MFFNFFFNENINILKKSQKIWDFQCFWTSVIREQSVTQGNKGCGVPRYPSGG